MLHCYFVSFRDSRKCSGYNVILAYYTTFRYMILSSKDTVFSARVRLVMEPSTAEDLGTAHTFNFLGKRHQSSKIIRIWKRMLIEKGSGLAVTQQCLFACAVCGIFTNRRTRLNPSRS